MAEIKTVAELSQKLRDLNPGVVVIHREFPPNTIYFGQWPERLTWPEGFSYDAATQKISGLDTQISAWPL